MLWAIIEAPLHGWTSALVLATGSAGLLVLVAFVVWERRCAHPMLKLASSPNAASRVRSSRSP